MPQTPRLVNLGSTTIALAIGLCVAPSPNPAAAQVTPRDSAFLVTTTQALLDAVTAGDTAVWSRLLAPDWIQADEEGQLFTRSSFLPTLHPLPAGQHGQIVLARWKLTGDARVAVISYDADETHNFYGQLLSTRFHITDTYVRRQGRWWQLGSQVTALPTAIAGIAIAPALAREYAGSYELTPEIHLDVAVRDSGLALERVGRPPERLYALEPRLFIRHGVRGFWVFERDSTGLVTGLVNWRDNNPVTWRRLK